MSERAYGRLLDKCEKLEADNARLRAVLGGLLKFCDVTSKAETDWERAVIKARAELKDKG